MSIVILKFDWPDITDVDNVVGSANNCAAVGIPITIFFPASFSATQVWSEESVPGIDIYP